MIGYITKVNSFGALARYLQSGTEGPTERRVLWTTARYVSEDLQKVAAEMNLTGHLTDTETLGYHLTIGYDPNDRPTRAEMEYAVERTLSALGLEENMAITAAHGDAYFAHTHTMVARWDYWTARLVEASNSYYVITRVMRELEDELGMEPAPRPYWERAGREKEGGRDGAESSPIRLDERFPSGARSRARSALRSATSWKQLQELLRREGLRFVRGRDNLLIAKGEVSVRAGQITGGTSLAKLEARFGQTLREHEAEVAGRLIEPGEDIPRKARGQEKTTRRTRKDDDTSTGRDTRKRGTGAGRKREGEERAEDLLLALAKAFRRREEAYQLTRRSALLEAEEADAMGLQQDLQLLETRGTALLEDLLQAGASSSQKRLSNGAFGESEIEESRRVRDQARELWRAAAWKVERQESARSITPESLREVLAGARVGKGSSEEERRLLALLIEHRRSVRQAVELFGPKATNARVSGGGNPSGERIPSSPSETETPDKESTTGADIPSAKSHSGEVLPGEQTRQDGSEISVDPTAATSPAGALLTETRESIREARLELEERLRGLQRQVEGGEGAGALERRLRRVLGRLADLDLEAASRFARRHVLEHGEEMEPGTEGGIGNKEPLEGENLQSPEVQEALRRALPKGVQLDGQKSPERKSPSRSR